MRTMACGNRAISASTSLITHLLWLNAWWAARYAAPIPPRPITSCRMWPSMHRPMFGSGGGTNRKEGASCAMVAGDQRPLQRIGHPLFLRRFGGEQGICARTLQTRRTLAYLASRSHVVLVHDPNHGVQ